VPDISKLIDQSVDMVLSKESANVVQQFQHAPSRGVSTHRYDPNCSGGSFKGNATFTTDRLDM
jgi:hypothetical protein